MRATDLNEKILEAIGDGSMSESEVTRELRMTDSRGSREVHQCLNLMERNSVIESRYNLGSEVYSRK